jgi:hypothetical protein
MMQTRFSKRNSGFCDKLGKILHLFVTGVFCTSRLCCECSNEDEALAKGGCPGCCDGCAHCQVAAEIGTVSKQQYAGPPPGVLKELPNHFINADVLAAVTGVVAQAPAQQVMTQATNPQQSGVTVSQV